MQRKSKPKPYDRPTQSKKKVVDRKIVEFRGEICDFNLPTLNNPFGLENFNYIFYYGISFPLEKFIDELEMIGKSSKDDKSEKRVNRLKFFQLCKMSDDLNILFQIFSNYLNGGNGDTFQYPSHIVLTVSGGNIFTIFAQLLYNIKNNEIDKTTREILGIYYSKNRKPFDVSLLTLNEPLSKLIDYIADNDYSDFDYKLSPNIYTATYTETSAEAGAPEAAAADGDAVWKKVEAMVVDDKDKGFVLVRAKSAFRCIVKEDNPHFKLYRDIDKNDRAKEACDAIGKKKEDLYPQKINRSDIDGIMKLYKDKKSKSDITEEFEVNLFRCKAFIEYLLAKKESISDNTKNNVKLILDVFKEAAEVAPMETAAGEEVAAAPQYRYNIDTIVDYIRLIVIELNEQIGILISTDPLTSNTYLDWVDMFLNLTNINKIPTMIATHLLIYFVTYDKFKVKEIIKKINKDSNTKFGFCRGRKSIYNPNIAKEVKQLLITKKREIPYGVALTLSSINTDGGLEEIDTEKEEEEDEEPGTSLNGGRKTKKIKKNIKHKNPVKPHILRNNKKHKKTKNHKKYKRKTRKL